MPAIMPRSDDNGDEREQRACELQKLVCTPHRDFRTSENASAKLSSWGKSENFSRSVLVTFDGRWFLNNYKWSSVPTKIWRSNNTWQRKLLDWPGRNDESFTAEAASGRQKDRGRSSALLFPGVRE